MLIKKLFFLLFVITIVVASYFFYFQKNGWGIKNIIDGQKEPIKMSDENKTINMVFVGDIMLSRAVGDKMAKENNWSWPFLKMDKWLADADLTFGNLEGPISDKGMNVGSIYSFRADPRATEGLKLAGFDVLSIANNHMGDWSTPAFEDTLNRLTEAGIDYVGGGFNQTEAYSPLKKTIKDTLFCFFAYTDLGPRSFEAGDDKSGMAFLDIESAQNDIEKNKNSCDLIIVSIHFGEEYKEKADSRQKTITKALVDSGANLIVGHHSHIISEVETIDNTQVFYSLGNFIFDQLFSDKTREGMVLVAEIKDKKIINLIPHLTRINNDFQPEPVISE
ncbi:MAG: CapA family protein [Candidatus Paceibacterota bacterium]|jgi:poly-gamma-glutamate synthesis protein (capsule biosynthesis protein)